MAKAKAQVAPLQWPDGEGLWWVKPPGDAWTVCKVERCCGGELFAQFIGSDRKFGESIYGPGGMFEGYQFVRAEPPTLPAAIAKRTRTIK
jgi:hypothetical protein